MPGLGALWDSLVDCICRPPRDEYIYPDELVGGSRKLFRVGRYAGTREDLTLTNKRGLLLQCSHYFPKHVRGKDGRLPCVIYCHCNSGSRRDAEEAICVLIPCGVSVFTLDFAGSGLSEGQWVTLGAEEVDDVATAVEHLREGGKVSTVGLWGRSMGAVTALLYSHRDPSIAGMVLDSPFARLTDLMLEIVQEQRLPIPRPLARLALAAMKRSVMKRAGFDITRVSPVDAVSRSHIPALFGHATGDTFVRISHAEALHGAYAGDKELIRFEGDHNSRRPEFFYNSVSSFWHRALLLEHLLEPADLSLPTSTPGARLWPGPSSGNRTGTGTGGSSSSTVSARGSAGRSLRPPPMRLRQPPAGPVLSAAAGAGAPSSGAADTAAAGGGGNDEDGDEGADVAASVPHRSAPWEPRLWELDPERVALERQRFRRMAGGLPSPSRKHSGGAAAAAAATDSSDVPLGPSGGSGGDGGGGSGGGGFRKSGDLDKLFAITSDDESLAVRLLGEDPQWSHKPPSSEAGPGAGPGAGFRVASAAAEGPPLTLPNGGLASDLLMATRLLPRTAAEEEEQLRAALQLSLLEHAGVPPPTVLPPQLLHSVGISGAATADATAAAAVAPPSLAPPQLQIQHQLNQQQAVLQLLSPAGEVALRSGPTAAVAPGSIGVVVLERVGGGGGGRAVTRPSAAAVVAAAATPALLYPDVALTRPQALTAAAELATTAVGPPDAAGALLPGRSNSHEGARVRPPLAVVTSSALSGPPNPGQQQPEGGTSSGFALLAEGAEADQGLMRQEAAGGPAAAAAAAAATGDGAKHGSTVGFAAPLGSSGRTVYDDYTEDELMALALRLSLQESAASADAVAGPGDLFNGNLKLDL